MQVIQKLKIQNRWEGKGNHRRECGYTVVSSHKFHKDEEVKNKVTKQ